METPPRVEWATEKGPDSSPAPRLGAAEEALMTGKGAKRVRRTVNPLVENGAKHGFQRGRELENCS